MPSSYYFLSHFFKSLFEFVILSADNKCRKDREVKKEMTSAVSDYKSLIQLHPGLIVFISFSPKGFFRIIADEPSSQYIGTPIFLQIV